MKKTHLTILICACLIAGGLFGWDAHRDWNLDPAPVAQAQTNATPPLTWSSWRKVSSASTSDFTTTVTSDIYDASNQPNIAVAVYTSTGVTAYTVVVETAPFNVSGAAWSEITTIDFTDDGSVASPKWQQVNIPGRYGKIRVRVTAITPGLGALQVWLAT